jgi:hypothetical protein
LNHVVVELAVFELEQFVVVVQVVVAVVASSDLQVVLDVL